MALIRRDAAGQVTRVAVHETKSLKGGGLAYAWPEAVASWSGTTPPAAPAEGAAPRISNLRAQMQPAQKGFTGAQPSALITWTTDRPCRAQVCFDEPGVGLRRTPLTEPGTEHSVTAWFLRPDRAYEFQAVAIGVDGRRSSTNIKP